MKYSILLMWLITFSTFLQAEHKYDLVVFGATPGGIATAISAKQDNPELSVALLEQTKHVGGLSTSGLNRDECNHMDRKTFGSLFKFFSLVVTTKSGSDPEAKGARFWQSHIAEETFLEMLKQKNVSLYFDQKLSSVQKDKANIKSITMLNGKTFSAKVFVDCTYEGDLMAKSGVSYALGRESSGVYNESLGGVRYLDKPLKISPYDDQGNLLPGVMPGKPPKESRSSAHPISYNIRMNLSYDPDNSVEITKPENYDRKNYILLERAFKKKYLKSLKSIIGCYPMPGGKVELNNKQYSVISLSMPGMQTHWSEASYDERDQIYKTYKDYTHGMLWFLKTDPAVPASIQKEMNQYGFCKDEWTDNDHWPWYIYVRAGRRMIGETVITQHDITTHTHKEDVIHIGSHFIDSHHVTRYAYDKDQIINEGRIWQKGVCFDIPYTAITPQAHECENLLVPVSLSASNVAFCAIRLEPTWMHLGEAAGIAASIAIQSQQNIQDIKVSELQNRIKARGIPLSLMD